MFDWEIFRILGGLMLFMFAAKGVLLISSSLAPEDKSGLIGSKSCRRGNKKCTAFKLTSCVSGFCHNHCLRDCGCGAGEEAKRLIEIYGTLAEADRRFRDGEKLETRKVLPGWRQGEKSDE